MRRLLSVFVIIAVALSSADSFARRTSQSVRKEKQETAQKIDRTRRQIKDNLAETRRELANLQSIEGEMRARRSEVAALRVNARNISDRSKALADSIDTNSERIKAIKASYGKALRAIRRQRHLSSSAAYVLSSESFSQARSRIRYLRELGKWQTEKALSLKEATVQLEQQRQRLDSLHSALNLRLDSISAIERRLLEQKHRSDAVVGSLKRQSRNLGKVLAEQEERARRLDNELNRIIEEESRAKTPPTPVQEAADVKLSGNFASNKGRLPSPVDREATIVSTFGRHTHDDYAKVQIQNNGIDFESSAGAQARAVFPGTVSMIIVMEGFENVVLVRHGEYLTVYAGIDGLKVRKGQQVEAGQALGSIATNASTGRTRLHFEVRHEKEKLDPSLWLR